MQISRIVRMTPLSLTLWLANVGPLSAKTAAAPSSPSGKARPPVEESAPAADDALLRFFAELDAGGVSASEVRPAELRRTFTNLIAKRRQTFSADITARRRANRKESDELDKAFQQKLKEKPPGQTAKERDQQRAAHYAENQEDHKKAEAKFRVDQKAFEDSVRSYSARFEKAFAALVHNQRQKVGSEKSTRDEEFRQLDKVPAKPLGTVE